MCPEEIIEELARILRQIKCPSKSTISFSGGLDSSILAYLSRGEDVELLTVGFRGSRDIENAREIASLLGMELHVVHLTLDDLLWGIGEISRLFPSLTAMEISFELPLLFTAKNSSRGRLCTGQGADELFGGYSKYLRNPELMKSDIKGMLERTLPRERAIAGHYGKELITPFVDDDILSLSREMPIECKINGGVRKWVLREAARKIGVPDIVVAREKKAAQYGSGIWKEMRREARRRGLSVDELVASLRERRD